MDAHFQHVIDKRIARTIANLEKNNMRGYFVADPAAALEVIRGLLKDGDRVAVGGSMTLLEIGLVDLLRQGNYQFFDRYQEGLTREQMNEIGLQGFRTDVFFTSTNAVTEDGELYNVDGKGTRVAPMLFGPKKVVVVAGVNKLVRDLSAAITRTEEWAAPGNAKRLSRKTPCVETGVCMDCQSPERLCNEYTVIKRQIEQDRIHVIFVNQSLGY